jgi:DNA-binding GntR family transcriptional regulator
VERIELEDLSQKVYRAIKDMILENELRSGDRLKQEELALQLGVSRTPLLSAISKLEKEMLVEIVPRKGAFVKKYSLDELIDIYAIRLRLEPLGAREAAEKHTEAAIAELEELIRDFHDSLESNDSGRSLHDDYYLHMKIMEMSGNRILYDIISSFNIVVLSNLTGFPRDPHESHTEHMRLFDAIKNGYATEAESVMSQHIKRSMKKLMEMRDAAAHG